MSITTVEEARSDAWEEAGCLRPGGDSDLEQETSEDIPVEVFTDGEEEELDTTGEQLQQEQKDMQGIPWDRLHFSREHYRETRLKQYQNYLNLPLLDQNKEVLDKECQDVDKGCTFYEFSRNSRSVHSTIVHFQLRNLVWATSNHDIYVMHDNCINHWSSLSRTTTKVLDLAGGSVGSSGLGRVQISTMCVKDQFIAAGGFNGELVVKNMDLPRLACSTRVTHNENGITNGIEIYDTPSGATRIMTSNNDAMLRTFDANSFECVSRLELPWAVNYATVRPGAGDLVAVVGDAPEAFLFDLRCGSAGEQPAASTSTSTSTHASACATLSGHYDYSFAAAWCPGGHILATGNQDTTTRLWDVRNLKSSLAVLKGRMGAVRSLRFSPDGRYLAMAEPADFVHIFDVGSGCSEAQEIDLFGEIAGIAFSPDSEHFFLGIADLTYSSLLQYHRSSQPVFW